MRIGIRALLLPCCALLAPACLRSATKTDLDAEIRRNWRQNFAHLAASPQQEISNLASVFLVRQEVGVTVTAQGTDYLYKNHGYLLEWEIVDTATDDVVSLYQIIDQEGQSRAWIVADGMHTYAAASRRDVIDALGVTLPQIFTIPDDALDHLAATGEGSSNLDLICKRALGISGRVMLTWQDATSIRNYTQALKAEYDQIAKEVLVPRYHDADVPQGHYEHLPPPLEALQN